MGLKFGTLWFGNKPTLLQQISWSSYIYHGHELNIYLYDMSIEVPDGAIKRDANEIILEKDIFLSKFDHKHFGEGHAQFADIFRIHMLKNTNLIWTDSDVVCLKDVWPNHEPYLLGYMIDQPYPAEGPIRANNDILYINDEKIIDDILDNFKDLPEHFGDNQTKVGPDLLTHIFTKHNLLHVIKDVDIFHPIRYAHIGDFVSPLKFQEVMDKISNSVAVSLFASSWLRHSMIIPKIENLDETTVLGYLAKKYIVNTNNKKTPLSNNNIDIDPWLKDADENLSPWFTKDRSETASKRYHNRSLTGNIIVENPALGLNVYKNVFSKEDANRYINILETNLDGSKEYTWSEAQVTNSAKPIKKARDCVDFKYKPEDLGPRNKNNEELLDLHKEIYQKLKFCIDDYANYWGINVVYYEAFNFVKYEGEGKHFNIHADHGPAYNCTVSAVIYINDDYEGGEIKFPRLDNYVHRPQVGDIAVFPSNYIYEHASLPMKSGTKYCVVVMTDINELGHK